jgi:hypothetical protein
VLTEAEVDRRFTTLVADLNSTNAVAALNSASPAVDGAQVTDPTEPMSPDDQGPPEPPGSDAGMVGLRVLAVGVAVVMCGIGVAAARALDLGVVLVVVWFVLVVPAVTLGSLVAVDRLRS